MYEKGMGVAVDYQKARRLYESAARKNYPDAQYALGKMYWEGLGVPKNPQTAEKWMRKSAAQGYQKAIQGIRTMGLN